jgi:UDPglucose--hexose-1-phosphate uridylyltransferase
VIIAPGREQRPGAARGELEPPTQEELDICPFCAGREDRTPPESLVLPAEGNWRVRVVPNLYPAFEHQEVVVHSPEHVRSLGELEDDQLGFVAEAWRQRAAVAHTNGFGYVQAIINEGKDAGASLAHSHSQLIWLREPPPIAAGEKHQLYSRSCVLCKLLAEQHPDGPLVIEHRSGAVLLAAPGGRAPYELLVAPTSHRPNAFEERELLGSALALVADAVRRLGSAEGTVPTNVWVHPDLHWHFEILPRLTVLAGLELGAGLYVNWLPPEEAAQRLRNAAV